ncbi:MAG: hypothetical protein WCB85_04925, partial [Candidatus Dormiibacterota bacterium]
MPGRSRTPSFRPGSRDLLEAVAELGGDAGVSEAELTQIVGRAIVDTYRRLVVDDPGLRARVDFHSGVHDVVRSTEGGGEMLLPPLSGDAARQAA